MANLKERYQNEVAAQLKEQFGYANVMQVPRTTKVTLNMGIGEATADKKLIDNAFADLQMLSGQKPIVTRARKSIANFKLREGNPIGTAVTLRGARMYHFLDRLVNTALPRIRDFRGISRRGFDGRGNFSIGIREQIIFPEIDYNQIDRIRGLQVTINTTANNDAEGIKFNAKTGDIVMKLGFPKESKLNLTTFNPTAITVTANGDIFLSNGYASNHIFKYDKTGKYLMHFGQKGNGMEQFNTAHGMTLDTRYDPPRLLICDRNHRPKGRLVHYSLEGKFLGEVVTGLGMPTSVSVQGDFVSVPDLHGRVVVLDKTNTIIAVLGHNPDRRRGSSFGIKQDQWIEGYFSGTHGSCWDAEGNLYVQDWNVSGRIMKLVKVKR